MLPTSSSRPPLLSPRQLSVLGRLGAFALRFWPLWSVWLLIATIPVSREMLQMHTFGSPLTTLYRQPWETIWGRDRQFDGFRAVKKNPRDVNARLWRFSLMLRGLGEDSGGGEDGDVYDQKKYTPDALLREANAIRAAFPQEKWLVSLPTQVISSATFDWRYNSGSITLSRRMARRLLIYVQNGARAEPDNAFYPLVEARMHRHTNDLKAMERALRRAALCSSLDTHGAEWTSRIVAAHGAIRPLLLEEKDQLWREHADSPILFRDNWTYPLLHDARVARNEGKHRRAIEVGAMLARIGDLMQNGKNSRSTAEIGSQWKNAVWNLVPLTKAQRRAMQTRGARLQSGDFARYAALHGRPDVAALVPQWAARQRQLTYLAGFEDLEYANPRLPRRNALWRAGWWRDAGAIVGGHLMFVAAFWMVANLFLWRAAGAPSTSRARTLPALSWALTAATLAWGTWQLFDKFDNSNWTMVQAYRQVAAGSVGVFAFFSAPFALALWCAFATMRQNKSRFAFSQRLQTEMRLFPVEMGILKAGATTLCCLAIVASFAVWAACGALLWNGTRSFDLTGWLPDGANGVSLSFPIQSEMLFAPLFYLLLLDVICFVLWFAKWRWFGGRENRAITHGGLRAWKEALGLYLVFGSIIYGATSLAAWPSRAAAHREIEQRAVQGELPPATRP